MKDNVQSSNFKEASFNKWADLPKALVLLASLKLYEELPGLGFQVLLIGSSEE